MKQKHTKYTQINTNKSTHSEMVPLWQNSGEADSPRTEVLHHGVWSVYHARSTQSNGNGPRRYCILVSAAEHSNICSTISFAMYNQSITASVVPSQWKAAVIKPVPKFNKPEIPSDYRPTFYCRTAVAVVRAARSSLIHSPSSTAAFIIAVCCV